MLKIIYGDLSGVAYNGIKKEIRNLIENKKRAFLIVPEQQAVVTEKELLSELDSSASLYLEVTNFTRLADTVYRRIGGLAGEYSTKAKEALVMWKTLTELAPFLDMAGGTPVILDGSRDMAEEIKERKITEKPTDEVTAGHVMKALAAVSELKSLCIDPKMLSELSDNESLKDTRLGVKLIDMANILTFYTRNLNKSYNSVRDVCDRLSETLKDPEKKAECFGEDTEFFIYGFTSFTDPQYNVILELIRSHTVTVHIPMAKHKKHLFEFTEIANTEKKLLGSEQLTGARIELKQGGDERREKRDKRLDTVCDLIWRNDAIAEDEIESLCEVIRIAEAEDPYEECEYIAADIKRRIIEGDVTEKDGSRVTENNNYRDFAIIARNSDKYLGIIDTALDSAGIPYFISHKKDISSYEAIKLIYAALGTVAGGFKREDVISYAKCNLSGIMTERCDEFELYTETWNISGSRFTDGIAWNMSPDGLSDGNHASDEEKEATKKRLLAINETRASLIDPLAALQGDLESAKNVREHAAALVKLLKTLSIEKKLFAKAQRLKDTEPETADACERLWGIICSALDDLVFILGDTDTNVESFINQLKIVFGEVDIGRIPTFHDTVTIGSADMLRLTEKKHIYLIGVNANEFPGAVSRDAYFTEKEKQLLSKIEVKIDGKPRTAYSENDEKIPYARELFFFSRAMWIANKSVTLSYSLRDAALEKISPSDAVARILKLMNAGKTDEKTFYTPKKIKDMSLIDRIFYPRGGLDAARDNDVVYNAIEKSGLGVDVRLTRDAIENANPVYDGEGGMYGDGDIVLSQTKIENYIDCPFAYFLNYNLKLSQNEKAEFDARNVGTFIHSILENFFLDATEELNKCKANDAEKYKDTDINQFVSSMKDDDRRVMVKKAAKAYLDTIDDVSNAKRQRLLLERLESAAYPVVMGICDELSSCKFVPTFFELPIKRGSNSLPDPIVITDKNGKNALVHGSIDRVDLYKTDDKVYVRVVDYKTGAKDFKPSDIKEGKNLQMFLYLKSIVDTEKGSFLESVGANGEDGKTLPLIPAGVIYTKTDLTDAKIKSPNDEACKLAIKDKQIRSGMLLNDGESIDAMNKDYIPNNLYTIDRWNEMGIEMAEAIGDISARMRNGDISLPNERGGMHCNTCKFRVICRKR